MRVCTPKANPLTTQTYTLHVTCMLTRMITTATVSAKCQLEIATDTVANALKFLLWPLKEIHVNHKMVTSLQSFQSKNTYKIIKHKTVFVFIMLAFFPTAFPRIIIQKWVNLT